MVTYQSPTHSSVEQSLSLKVCWNKINIVEPAGTYSESKRNYSSLPGSTGPLVFVVAQKNSLQNFFCCYSPLHTLWENFYCIWQLVFVCTCWRLCSYFSLHIFTQWYKLIWFYYYYLSFPSVLLQKLLPKLKLPQRSVRLKKAMQLLASRPGLSSF